MNNITILQFGEGNFLRAFADWMMSKDSVIVVKPRPGKGLERLLDCKCRYNVALQGLLDGETVDTVEPVDSIAGAINPYEQHQEFLQLAETASIRIVVSNTTEAGIVFDPACQWHDAPALSYPGKLTQWLHHRWQHFQGAADAGVTILPCELIFHNGAELHKCIQQYIAHWQLSADFAAWVEQCCPIYNTLVDRIVPGGEEYTTVKAEPYHLWVIEGPESLRQLLPLRRQDLNIQFVENEQPYHLRKVTLLNGPHTAMSAVGHLAGLETVRDCMLHPQMRAYVDRVMREELLPTVDLPREELEAYAQDIQERFLNPYVRHLLTSIMLNNLAKYRTRDLPSLRWHVEHRGILPPCLTLALAANLICANRDASALSDNTLWGEDLTQIPNLQTEVSRCIDEIQQHGILSILEK